MTGLLQTTAACCRDASMFIISREHSPRTTNISPKTSFGKSQTASPSHPNPVARTAQRMRSNPHGPGRAPRNCTALGWWTLRSTSISDRKSPSAMADVFFKILAATAVPCHIALYTMPNSPSPEGFKGSALVAANEEARHVQ